MNIELNPVDTHLMLTNSDPNAFTRLLLDTECKMWESCLPNEEKTHRSDADLLNVLFHLLCVKESSF